MSQEKVNKYKEEKANRKAILKKEKRNRMIGRIVGSVIGLALVGWIGFSIYDKVVTGMETAQTEVKLDAVSNYLTGLNTADAGEDTEE